MAIKLFPIILILLLISCKEKQVSPTKDFGDVVPKSQTTKSIIKDSVLHKVDSQKINEFVQILDIKIDSVITLSNNLIPDRFNPVSKTKEVIYSGSDSIQFLEWKYKDSVSTKRALYNLMDCLEYPCISLKLFESKNVSKNSFMILYNAKNLVYINSTKNNINISDWLNFFKERNLGSNFELVITQKKMPKFYGIK